MINNKSYKKTIKKKPKFNKWIKTLMFFYSLTPWMVSFLIMLSIMLGVGMVATPFIVKDLTEVAINKNNNFDTQDLIVLVSVLASLVISRVILKLATGLIGRKMGIIIEVIARKMVIDKAYKLPISYYDKHNNGEFYSRVIQDPRSIFALTFNFITENLLIIIGITFGLFYAFDNSWHIGVGILGVYILGIILTLLVGKKMVKSWSIAKKEYAELGKLTNSQLTAISEIKVNDSYSFESKKFIEVSNRQQKAKSRTITFVSIYSSISLLIALAVSVGITIIAGVELYYKKLDVPTFSAFVSIGSMLIMPITRISSLFFQLTDSIASIKRFNKLMKEKEEVFLDKEFQMSKGKIEFKNVFFKYKYESKSIQVLNDFSLVIKPNQKIAFVGKSGIGKSTILKLILGLYPIQKGEILIDGQNISKVNISQVRKSISYIQQSGIIFSSSIKENIIYNKQNVTQEMLDQVSKDALIDDLIKRKDNGWDEFVGPSGSQLSGGQKQRISIARNLIKNNKIILLDEATSALDNKTEKIIQMNFDKKFKNSTVVTVAHRISTIIDSDVIILLGKNGLSIEKGSYKELIAKKGEFYKLEKKEFDF
ncbi:MAG: ABC transporter ATP-binding protein/permease [Mollicutes bacterium PWAP]|nr:ABC transporter ATP-binding protein/permease [Mollicutes bacterium PWAP]